MLQSSVSGLSGRVTTMQQDMETMRYIIRNGPPGGYGAGGVGAAQFNLPVNTIGEMGTLDRELGNGDMLEKFVSMNASYRKK